MSESNECCGECDASRKSYPVGTCAYAGDCPCHSTTPDTEWEKEVREEWDRYNNGKFCSLDCTIDFIAHLITSRDTYWKERVRKEVEGMKGRYKDCENGEMWDEALNTLLDNLK